MGFLTLPSSLTEEEELLLQKYAKLKKKKKALAAMKAPKLEKQESVSESLKRPAEAAADATEQAKKLLKSGAIKVEPDRREQQTFKRMKRQKDAEKPAVGFRPFAYSSSIEGNEESKPETPRPKQKINLYESFVSASDSKHDDVGSERHDRRPIAPQRGNTVYVRCRGGISEELLRRAFAGIGGIVNISVETDKNCGFVTFDKMELADQAILEVNDTLVSNVQLRVSIARRQPSVDMASALQPQLPTAAVSTSDNTWSSIAASSSQKGSHHDNRDLVAYDDDLF